MSGDNKKTRKDDPYGVYDIDRERSKALKEAWDNSDPNDNPNYLSPEDIKECDSRAVRSGEVPYVSDDYGMYEEDENAKNHLLDNLRNGQPDGYKEPVDETNSLGDKINPETGAPDINWDTIKNAGRVFRF